MMGLVATNSPCPMISKSSINEKERGGFHIKMEASQISLPEKKVRAIVEKLARDRSLKEPPICIFSGRNLGISHLKRSCENMPLKIRRPSISSQKVHGEDVSEVKVSAYQCTSKELQDKMISRSWNKVKEDKDMEATKCEVKPVMHVKQNLPKVAENIMGEESSENCQSSTTTEKGQELEDTTELDSKSYFSPESMETGEIFQESDLHFGEEDWSNLPMWCSSEGDAEGDMTFHSLSRSETSSSSSTLELSNFFCRSEASSFSGRENEPSSSIHSSMGSIDASIVSPNLVCKSSFPATHLQKQAISTDISSHDDKEVFPTHPQTNSYNQSQLYEYLNVSEGMMVMTECSEVGKINEIASLLKYKEISPSTCTNFESCHFPGIGVTVQKDNSMPPNELDVSPTSLHSTEECPGGLAATEVLLAKNSSPEINSENAQDGNDAASQLILKTEYSMDLGSPLTEAFEDNGNIQIDDGSNDFSVTNMDSSYINVGDRASIVKSTSVLDLPIKRESSDLSVSVGTCLSLVDIENETSSVPSMDIRNTMSSKSLQFKLQSTISNDQWQPFSSTEETFLESNSAAWIDPQCSKRHANVPVKSVASTVQLQCEKPNINGSSMHAPRNYVNRKTKSFSFSSCPYHPIQTRESSFANDGCKVCGNMTVSPVGWLSPIVKHPGSFSPGYLGVPALHSLDENTSVWSPEKASMKLVQKNHHLWSSPGYVQPRSKKLNKELMPYKHLLNMDLENGVFRKLLSPISKRSGSSITWKHEPDPERLSIATPETERSHPSASASPTHPLISQGLLHCSCKDGFPYFSFSLNESEKAFVAKKWKVKNRGREGFDWLYTFHSGPDNKTILNLLKKNKNKWVASKDEHVLDLVGHMRVTSSLCPETNSFGSLEIAAETEFVLFGVNIEHIKERPARQSSSTENRILLPDQSDHTRIPNGNCGDSRSTSITSFSPISDNTSFVPSYVASTKHAIKNKTSELWLSQPSQQRYSEFFQSSLTSRSVDGNAVCVENWGNWGISDAELCLSQPFSPHLELTATVIRTPSSQAQTVNSGTGKDTVSKNPGGWGLKFLDRSLHNSKSIHPHDQDDSRKSECSNNSSVSSTPTSAGCASDDQSPGQGLGGCHLNCKRQCKTSITALVPADIHGLPKIKSSGPLPLIERWRLGGRCDCGGWDMGCALTLLHSRKQRSNSDLIETNSKAEDYNSLYVLPKGDTPALTMTAVADGLYSVSFQSQLKTLQVFSIVLSMLHSREEIVIPPAMHNNNNNNNNN